MSLYFASINSGSNGNCYYIGSSREAVLVDAGISCRETEKRMKRAGLSMERVKAIFISHEHSDHIRGVEVLSRKYRLPVYITSSTLRSSSLKLERGLARSFTRDEAIEVGGISVLPFFKNHDAADPHSFVVEHEDTRVGVFTDIGTACGQVVKHFKSCHAIFLEANYDEEMLEKGRYPYYLKKRIRSDQGHLSNAQALELFLQHRPDHMSHVLLSHLSKENNEPRLVQRLFSQHAGNITVTVASRDEESEVFFITPSAQSKRSLRPQQLSIF